MKSTDDIIGKGTLEPRLQERRTSIALEELTISFKAAQDTIQKGEGNNLPHNYIYSCGARVFEIRHQLHNIFLRCLWRQQRLLNAIIAFIDTQAETNRALRHIYRNKRAAQHSISKLQRNILSRQLKF